MAVTRSFAPAKTYGLYSTPVEEAKEAASQTYTKGAVLIPSLTSSAVNGYVAEGAADPAAGVIIGVALEAGKNTSAGVGTTHYVPALPGVIFEGQVYHGTAASAVIATADRFKQYGIAKSGANWVIDKSETTHKDVRIVGFKDPVGTLNGVVYFVFASPGTIYGAAIT